MPNWKEWERIYKNKITESPLLQKKNEQNEEF